ncbi:hypothetical protein HELRODRAFT_184746 [Helobdella robusta]|uniref:Uncharacterized protein n=1 Tax=Helobdella robusta TaxID=6412 RepID=T1FLX1_HELRO|nr:hypothetical protein HELRODRAFT_184746 [Helobdella robusta]ESO00746.1 hypothetical protein HELRODRAFT_184746 [Helobdella robusta]
MNEKARDEMIRTEMEWIEISEEQRRKEELIKKASKDKRYAMEGDRKADMLQQLGSKQKHRNNLNAYEIQLESEKQEERKIEEAKKKHNLTLQFRKSVQQLKKHRIEDARINKKLHSIE